VKVGFYQFDVAPGLPEKNLQSIEQGTLGLDVELLVLPELCTSGYLMTSDEALRLAIELPGDGIEPFVRIARRLDAWLLAGVLERRADKLYNTTVIVGPDGWRGSQRKVHLTTLERSVFAGGEAFQVFDLGAGGSDHLFRRLVPRSKSPAGSWWCSAPLADIDVAQANDKANVMCPDLSAEWRRYYQDDSLT
jgi:hypothetical protein